MRWTRTLFILTIYLQLNKAFSQNIGENTFSPISEILRLKWQTQIEKWDAFNDRPLLVDGILFLYANTDFAIDAKSGEKLYYADP